MTEQLLSRRRFAARCAALGLSLPVLGAIDAPQASSQGLGTAPPAKAVARTVKLPDGNTLPALGQGCWHLGDGKHPAALEEAALRTGVSLGMRLLDTSGNYGGGRSEQLISHVLTGERERIFLVSKVEAHEVAGDGIARACAASLERLGTDYLDLYLLHAPTPSAQFAGVVAAFEQLRAARKIRAWGVSNFNVEQMEALLRVPDGRRCATNQVPYSLNNRSIERELLPWCNKHGIPVMAYSPLGGEGNLVIGERTLKQIGATRGCSPAAVALAWVIRGGTVIAIPESGTPEHTRENAVALSMTLTPQELKALDAAFHAPFGPAWLHELYDRFR
ncbi:MAG TPA: aldo/keto reductase [Steroidobacteraceae bacterium]|nr:aldo/keto reductase [Steroidobacteraceae bacterium]